MSTANIATCLLLPIALFLGIFTLILSVKSIQFSYQTFTTGQTPKGNQDWHNLKGEEAASVGRGRLIGGILGLFWALIFLSTAAYWLLTIVNTWFAFIS